MLAKVLGLVVLLVSVTGLNTLAVMIVTGRNPILGGGFNFLTGKWEVGRHKDNLGSKVFGYLFAAVVFAADLWMALGLTKALAQ